jgi:hypothetical protein
MSLVNVTAGVGSADHAGLVAIQTAPVARATFSSNRSQLSNL